MSRYLSETLEEFGTAVQQLAMGEIARGAPVMNVTKVLAGITGAVASAAIQMKPHQRELIHVMIDESVAAGLVAHLKKGSAK